MKRSEPQSHGGTEKRKAKPTPRELEIQRVEAAIERTKEAQSHMQATMYNLHEKLLRQRQELLRQMLLNRTPRRGVPTLEAA